jgi:hypothetical protein
VVSGDVTGVTLVNPTWVNGVAGGSLATPCTSKKRRSAKLQYGESGHRSNTASAKSSAHFCAACFSLAETGDDPPPPPVVVLEEVVVVDVVVVVEVVDVVVLVVVLVDVDVDVVVVAQGSGGGVEVRVPG